MPANIQLNFSSFTPSFLNMSGQMGIFKANGRLGFWDSANSVSWSSLFDHSDFTPSLETLAGNATFNALVGRIVTILPQGEGFVIYATKSIVGVRYSTEIEGMIWEAFQITSEAGIVYPFQVTTGRSELEHFAFTTSGIKRIGTYNVATQSHKYEEIVTDVYDYLKESREPIKLNLINGRYLCFSTVSPDYIDGKVSFKNVTTDEITVNISAAGFSSESLDFSSITIGPQSITSKIMSELGNGVTEGVYTQWVAVGKKTYPSWLPSYINPYNTDDFHHHIPNPTITITDYLPDYSNTPTQHIGPLGDFEEENTYEIELGWGSAPIAALDTFANEFIQAQVAEWNKAAAWAEHLSGILLTAKLSPDEVILPTTYTWSEANIALNQLEASDTTVIQETLGYLYTNPVISSPTINTVLGHYATATIKAEYQKAYKVIRDKFNTYSIEYTGHFRRLNGYATIYHYYVYVSNNTAFHIRFPANFIAYWYFLGTSEIDEDILAFRLRLVEEFRPIWMAAMETKYIVQGYPYDTAYPATATLVSEEVVDNGNILTVNYYFNFTTETNGGVQLNNVLGMWIDFKTFPADPYQIKKITHYPIDVQPLTGVSYTSEVTLRQRVLDWAIFPQNGVENSTTIFGAISIPSINIPGWSTAPTDVNVTYPSSTFLLQEGSVHPVYPEYKGALVLDLALNKWGKLNTPHQALIDFLPINTGDDTISYTKFGMDMGMLDSSGKVKLFDAKPSNSWIRYGKIGYYRTGMTKALEVRAHFRTPFTGTITLDSSLDGRALEIPLHTAMDFSDKLNAILYATQTGRWHTITISGQFDLQYLEFRATIAGRR